MKKSILIVPVIIFLCYSIYPALCQTAESMTVSGTIETIPVTTPEASPAVTVPAEQPKVQPSGVKLRDVPDDHWAASSVYDLVNMGVTQGYPDGTFRGNNYITRYDTAVFLSKLAVAMGSAADEMDVEVEKMKDDLRAEIRTLRAEIAELKRMPAEGEEKPITGSFTSRFLLGNLIANHPSVEGETSPNGPLVRYRLKMTFAKNVGDSAKIKVNLDTMDSGFGGGSGDLSARILDVEGDMSMDVGLDNPLMMKVTAGPGPVVHTEEANANGDFVARSENGVVYVRPWNSIMLSTDLWNLDMSLGYIARRVSVFGEVEVNQIASTIGYDFPGLFFIPSFRLTTNIDYLSANPQASPTGPTDTKYTFNGAFNATQKFRTNLIYSLGQGDSPHNTLIGIEESLLDPWDSGTTIDLSYRKVGAEYLHENAALSEDLFSGLDYFDRYIGDGNGLGVVDIGGRLVQVITENIDLISRFDWRLAPDNAYDPEKPQVQLLIDAGLAWNIATDTTLTGLYRVQSIPSAADQSTDLLELSLSFKY